MSLAPSYQINDKLRFLVDFQYSRKGYVRDYIFSSIDPELRYSYLDVIPEIEFKVRRFFSIGFGLNYAFLINEDQKTEPGNWINTRLCCVDIFYFVFRDSAKYFQQKEVCVKFKQSIDSFGRRKNVHATKPKHEEVRNHKAVRFWDQFKD